MSPIESPPPYGPSNYDQRPNEVTSAVVKAPSPAHDGLRAFVQWDAPALMRQQANLALEGTQQNPGRPYSPDALWGLADKIQQLSHSHDAREEFRKLLTTHRTGIEEALQRYAEYPQEQIRAYVAEEPRLPGAHPRLLGISGSSIQNAVSNYYQLSASSAQGLTHYADTFHTVSMMMHVVAFREDQAARVGSYRT
jgi:hypothetical protein